MSDENTCRICRCESTPEDPLYHPCKCKGSIKYIHQDCLMEWLAHSKKDSVCDICHEKYHFTTLFAENVPDRVPLKVILDKAVKHCFKLASLAVIVLSTFVFIVVEVPVFTVFTIRSLLRSLSSSTRKESFMKLLIFGDAEIDLSKPWLTSDNLLVFLKDTYLTGLLQFLFLVLLAVILFTQHEWVSKDEGFTTILNRRIGPEKPFRALEALQAELHGIGARNGDILLDAVVRPAVQERIRRARLEAEAEAVAEAAANPPREDDAEDEWMDFVAEEDDNAPRMLDQEGIQPEDNAEPEGLNGDREILLQQFVEQVVRDVNPEQRRRREQNRLPQRIVANRAPGAEVPVVPVVPAVPEEPEQGIDVMVNIDFDSYTAVLPVQLAIIANMATVCLSMALGFMPCVAGTISLPIFHLFVQKLIFDFPFLGPKLKAFAGIISQKAGEVLVEHPLPSSVQGILVYAKESIVSPILENYWDVLNISKTPTITQVAIRIGIGYLINLLLTFAVMKYFEKGCSKQHPLTGVYRRYYTTLLEIVSTLKLFVIFGTEQILFPSYCGYLLDFVLSPLFTHHGGYWMTAELIPESLKSSPFPLWNVRWVVGTFFMCLFALYVGMVRRRILRPGVLYFIKSPDDPNVRLVHDALVRPLYSQMSRIALSGVIYSFFIVVEIGALTWGLKHIDFLNLLPLKIDLFSCFLGYSVVHFKIDSVLVEAFVAFWKASFTFICSQLRMSHFIVNHPVPEERGRVVYRSIFHQLLRSKPDYSQPMSYESAVEMFKSSPGVNAAFVPNGSYMRVPDNDNVSRKFLRELFVPVTKDDELLDISNSSKAKSTDKPAESTRSAEDSDDEDFAHPITSYTVVYAPPSLGKRSLLLLASIWVAAIGITAIGIAWERLVSRMLYELKRGLFRLGGSTPYAWDSHVSMTTTVISLVIFAGIYKVASNGQIAELVPPNFNALVTKAALHAFYQLPLVMGLIEFQNVLFALPFSQVFSSEIVSYSLPLFWPTDFWSVGKLILTLCLFLPVYWPTMKPFTDPRPTRRQLKMVGLGALISLLGVAQFLVYSFCFYRSAQTELGFVSFSIELGYAVRKDLRQSQIASTIMLLDWFLFMYLVSADAIRSVITSTNEKLKAEYYGVERRLANAN
ncbi:unnamed protein product [Kuraishia capsulata CBS 1993]|uniref:RING-type E3 ubiquitin transferase n=1 Tax=Kuraishia capsulata CBS 1993 TaxID=1382522 RepID=W6MR66_9ASCO|nr:uncharacterized protein KUCA_T00005199001 [Kuraishia capsulata CBS 1993]CDK29211.1 unnamed protein product [Kuraishia capsulata CBS 1993]